MIANLVFLLIRIFLIVILSALVFTYGYESSRNKSLDKTSVKLLVLIGFFLLFIAIVLFVSLVSDSMIFFLSGKSHLIF